MDEKTKKTLLQMYNLAQEIMEDCPDEGDCSDAENDVIDEVANFLQAMKNAKIV